MRHKILNAIEQELAARPDNTLKDRCGVITTYNDDRFHSFIKERNARARGFATKHLIRYAALFCSIFGSQEDAPDKIFEIIKSRNDRFMSIEELKSENLLLVSTKRFSEYD